jgi:nitrite reductase (NADH) small subunit
MDWIDTLPLADLPPGSMRAWDDVLLCNHEGEVRALSGVCPHARGPLAQGNFEEGRVVCPWHAWEFDTATGACTHNDRAAIARYDVEIRDGVIRVRARERDA